MAAPVEVPAPQASSLSKALDRHVKNALTHNPQECTLQGTICIAKNTFDKLDSLANEVTRVEKWQKTKVSFSIASTTILTAMAVSLLVVGILLGGAVPCIAGLVFVGILSVGSFKKIYKNHQYFKSDQIAPLKLLQGIQGLNKENLLQELEKKYNKTQEVSEKNSYAMMASAYHFPSSLEQNLNMANFRFVAIKVNEKTVLQIRDEEGSNTHDKQWKTWDLNESLFKQDFNFTATSREEHVAFDLRKRDIVS